MDHDLGFSDRSCAEDGAKRPSRSRARHEYLKVKLGRAAFILSARSLRSLRGLPVQGPNPLFVQW